MTDDEIEAVARALAKLHGDAPRRAMEEWGNRARVAVEALDRVRDARGDDEVRRLRAINAELVEAHNTLLVAAARSPQGDDHEAVYRCGVNAAGEVTCDRCPDPDGCIDFAQASAPSPSRDGTVVCQWCEGSGWLCDGCQRPEALCMASACRGAALSMSGCPKCFVPGGCGGRGYISAPSRDGSVAVEDATWRDVVAWLRRCRTAFHEDGLRWADLIEREFSPASIGDRPLSE
jgi:hypothetical protein